MWDPPGRGRAPAWHCQLYGLPVAPGSVMHGSVFIKMKSRKCLRKCCTCEAWVLRGKGFPPQKRMRINRMQAGGNNSIEGRRSSTELAAFPKGEKLHAEKQLKLLVSVSEVFVHILWCFRVEGWIMNVSPRSVASSFFASLRLASSRHATSAVIEVARVMYKISHIRPIGRSEGWAMANLKCANFIGKHGESVNKTLSPAWPLFSAVFWLNYLWQVGLGHFGIWERVFQCIA